MTERPLLPPPFRASEVAPEVDPFERCLALAGEGAEAGTLLWSTGPEACECAVVLAPEQSLERSLPIILVAMLGLGDALGALVPPVTAVTFGWPDRVEVNGGVVGGVRMANARTEAAGAVPDWLVIGFRVVLRGAWSETRELPSDRVHRTTLEEEGCGEVEPLDLLEAYGRHFLSWINRWQEDGVAPVQQAWLTRATGLGKPIEVDVAGQKRQGTFAGITDTGALRLVRDGVTQTVSLDDAIRVPTWAVSGTR